MEECGWAEARLDVMQSKAGRFNLVPKMTARMLQRIGGGWGAETRLTRNQQVRRFRSSETGSSRRKSRLPCRTPTLPKQARSAQSGTCAPNAFMPSFGWINHHQAGDRFLHSVNIKIDRGALFVEFGGDTKAVFELLDILPFWWNFIRAS